VSTGDYYLLGVVLFIVGLLLSIGLHELGHLIPAKRFGGKVTQYFIGFGPTVWSRQRGETEVGLKAIPLGGYVKIVGMLPPGPEQERDGDGQLRVRQGNTGMFTQLISDARASEWEAITPEDEPRLFYKLAWWKKVIVMAGGPTVNLLIAFALFAGVYGIYGEHDDVVRPGAPVIASVSRCVLPYDTTSTTCHASDPIAPAWQAGLRPGDRVTSFNGVPITGWNQLRGLIQRNASGKAVIGYERDGVAHTGTTDTTVELRPTNNQGTVVRKVGFLGISPAVDTVVHKHGPVWVLGQMATMAGDALVTLVELPQKVWGVGEAIVGVKPRSLDSPMSVVGGGRIAGQEFSAPEPAGARLSNLLYLVASFNLFIGLLNFVPLLPLDGGHIASALWEAIRRGVARRRRRPDPGHVDAAKLLPVAYVVACCLLVMSVVLIVGDLVAPIQVPGG